MSPVKFTFKSSHSGSNQNYPLQDQADLSRQHEVESHVSPPSTVEPHIGSFMKASSVAEDNELTPEEIRKDTDIIYHPDVDTEGFESEEESRDRSLSIVFTLVGALVIIAGVGFYVKNYIQPSRMDVIPELLINSPDEQGGDPNLSPSEESIRGYRENLERMNADAVRLAQATAQASSSLDAETFAQPRTTSSTSTNKSVPSNSIFMEYVIKATSTRASTTARTQVLSELVVSEALGISFKKDPFWKQTTEGDSIVLKQVGPEGKDVIFLTRFHGGSVTTQDTAYGNVTYFYEAGQKSWMRIDYVGELSSQGIIHPEVFVPFRFTKEGKPIFDGTSRAKTLIVALGVDDFVIVNISGTGYTRILDTFVTGISINQ